MKNIVSAAIAVIIMFAGFSMALPIDSIKTDLVGMGSIEAGQFVKAESKGTSAPLEKIWYERVYMHIGFTAQVNQRTKLYFIGESQTRYAYFQSKDYLDNDRGFYYFYPHWTEISYSFGDIENPWLKIGGGVFPFKYNPDVTDLGEFLFRTGSYPPTMMNTFDFPMARITGFRASSVTSPLSYFLGNSTVIDSLNLYGIMNTESQIFPLQDFGLAFVGDYTLFHSITLGGGVFFSHLFSVNDDYTTPKNNFNMVIDTATGDSVYLTFKATKLMGRVTLDPKPLLKLFIPMDIFGENDLKVYSEAAVLSLKDYPVYYSELFRRIPRMVGFNYPTHQFASYCLLPGIIAYCLVPDEMVKVSALGAGGLLMGVGSWLLDRYLGTNTRLDLIAGELEYYGWNYANSYSDYLFQNLIPRPDDIKPGFNYKDNVWKWSIYGKRRIGNHFSITGQIAYDHMRLEQNMYVQSIMYNGDAMQKRGDWAWICKMAYNL